jgi:cytoskeletal protein RodZ
MNKIFGGIADTNRMLLGHSLTKDLITHRENEGADAQIRVDTNREATKAAADKWRTREYYKANREHLKKVNRMTNQPEYYPEGHKKAGQPNPDYWTGAVQAGNEKGTSFQKNPTYTGKPAASATTPDTSTTETNTGYTPPPSQNEPTYF